VILEGVIKKLFYMVRRHEESQGLDICIAIVYHLYI